MIIVEHSNRSASKDSAVTPTSSEASKTL